MADKYIHNDDTQNHPGSVDYNQWLKRLETELNETTNQNSIKLPKVVEPTNKKTLLYNFGDQCNKQPNIPSLSAYTKTNGNVPSIKGRCIKSDREGLKLA